MSSKCVELKEHMILGVTKMSRLSDIKKVNYWGKNLEDIRLVREMKNVETISLSVNFITKLKDFSYCPHLKELYLRKNNIKDLAQISYLTNLSNLRVLWLSGNPCSDVKDYRLKVIAILPQLEKLDEGDVTDAERQQAKARYANWCGRTGETPQTPAQHKFDFPTETDNSTPTQNKPRKQWGAQAAPKSIPNHNQPILHHQTPQETRPSHQPSPMRTPIVSQGDNVLHAVLMLCETLTPAQLNMVEQKIQALRH
mmetsp:Transcript_8847/g.13130  ORF Transcript_8847/g.13130 Transcript_8847/m.13130 type:complete len:254 (+) Transcript_8847:45-806(+)